MNTCNLRFRSNRVRDIAALFHQELDAMYGKDEVRVFCEMLFEAFFGWDRVRLMTSREETVNQSDLLRFHWALEDLKKQRPIQHIIGYKDFCGCRIEVNPDVLIPRPETEEMVEWVCTHRNQSLSTILDLCTGSGCIAIALKKAFPQADVTAVDVSEKALEIARRNAERNAVNVRFLQCDVLGMEPDLSDPLSTIISNPPYVLDSERADMRRNVLDYDPPLALFVPDSNPLLFYRAIARIAQRHLCSEGLLAVEINERYAEEVCNLFRQYGFIPQTQVDFRGKPRWVSATR